MAELQISMFSPYGPMNLPSLEQWCCRKHVEIYLQNITTMRKFWLDVATVVITTLPLKQSLQTRSSAFCMTNLTTGLLCQIFLTCIFFLIEFIAILARGLILRKLGNVSPLSDWAEWISSSWSWAFFGKLVYVVMISSAKPRPYQAFPTAPLDYTMKLITRNVRANSTFP